MGTSDCVNIPFRSPWDHPHAYGDKLVLVAEVFVIRGSSPRVWGQVCKTSAKLNEVRIIPTRMGTSNVKLFRLA